MAVSDDLRERVVDAVVLGGLSRNQAAAHFKVSVASAVRWVKRFKTTGEISPAPSGGDRRSGRIEAHRDYLLGLIRRSPDMTLLEIKERLIANCGERFAVSVLWRFFDRHEITFKKRSYERVGLSFEDCVGWTQRRLRFGLAELGSWTRRNAPRRSGNWRWPKRTIRSTLRLTLSMPPCCLMRLLLRPNPQSRRRTMPRLRKTCCRRSGGVGLRALAVRTAVGMTFVPGARLAASLGTAARVAGRHSTR